MKQLQLAFVMILSGVLSTRAQTSVNPIPNGFNHGIILMPDNTTREGYVKNNMKKSGEVIFVSGDGKKQKYTASGLSGVTIDKESYIVANNAFYRVVVEGEKIKLLRKASNSTSIQYNGSEPIVSDAGEGNFDDYFIQTPETKKPQLVRKKDFSKIFSAICADCTRLADDVKANRIGFSEIEQAVALYNSCTK